MFTRDEYVNALFEMTDSYEEGDESIKEEIGKDADNLLGILVDDGILEESEKGNTYEMTESFPFFVVANTPDFEEEELEYNWMIMKAGLVRLLMKKPSK